MAEQLTYTSRAWEVDSLEYQAGQILYSDSNGLTLLQHLCK